MTSEHPTQPPPSGEPGPDSALPAASPEGVPTDLHTDRPHPARVYDYLLGGKDNFERDRALAEQIKQIVPTVPMMIRANRDWMRRATRYLVAEAGIRQILDIGTGIPTEPNLHQVAQKIAPETRVAYVDNDPIVLVHARALLTSTPEGRCDYIDADLRDIDKLLNHPLLTSTFDPTRPVAVMAASVLMLLADEANPWAITAKLRNWAPDGSYLAISHPTGDVNPEAMAAVATTTRSTGVTFVPRSRADVARMFGDWQMVEPGLVPVLAWRSDGDQPEDLHAAYYWAGIAHKPQHSTEIPRR